MKCVILAIACCLSLWACNSASNEKQMDVVNASSALASQSKLNDTATYQSVTILHQYYLLKDALVAGSAGNADIAASRIDILTDSLKLLLSKDTAARRALLSLDSMQIGVNQILAYKDETCEVKRVHFEKVSNSIISFIKNIDLKTGTIYIQYCPMALNDKGAYWLSNSATIENPYFGKKMLECGEVVETIQ